MMSNNDSLLAK